MRLSSGDDHSSNGLAALLQPEDEKSHIVARNSAAPDEHQLAYCSSLQHVLDLSPAHKAFAQHKDAPINVAQLIDDKISDINLQHHGSSHSIDGRLGPLQVSVDPNSCSGSFSYGTHDLYLESLTNFSSCRAGVCVFKGKWMYECTLHTAGIQQVGWATIHCPFTAEEGVGDAPDSYAYDGKRMRKWSINSAAYGEQWAPGDVIGVCIDLDACTISFHRNGVDMGVAFNNVRTMQLHLAYFPAVSLSHAERCELNFGAQPLQYPVAGYAPLQPPLPPAQLAVAGYLTDSLQRLLRLGHQQQQPALATALSGAAAGQQQAQQTQQEQQTQQQPGLLAWHDTVVLGATLLQRMQRLMVSEYFISSSLVQLLLSCHGGAQPHRPDAVRQLLSLAQLALDPRVFTKATQELLLQLSRRCKTAPLRPAELPHSGSYTYIALMNCLVQVPAVKAIWLQHPHFHLLTEGFLTRKSPTPDDLKVLLPHVWWRGCTEQGLSQEAYQQQLARLAAAVELVDEQQLALLAELLGCPAQDDPGQDAFLEFVRYMIHKNAGAARDVPPPGLSEQTVLISLYFVLQRLLLPHMASAAASGSGPLAAFPAHELFVASHSNDLHPLHDTPRMGGIMSHLLREVVVAREHRGAVQVKVPLPPPAADPVAEAAARKLQPEWLPELLNATLMLYNWRASTSLRTMAAVSQVLASSTASLEEMDRSIARQRQQQAGGGEARGVPAHMAEARAVFLAEATANTRLQALLHVVFLRGSMQRLLFSQAAYLAALLHSTAVHHANLLGYVPTFYMECVIDAMGALRRAEQPFPLFLPTQQLQQHGLGAPIALLATLLNDSRIANPDIKEALLQCTSSLLGAPDFLWGFEHSEEATRRLVPAAMAVFDSRLWHPASQVLLRLIKGAGFGEAGFSPVAEPGTSSSGAAAAGSSGSDTAAGSTSSSTGSGGQQLSTFQQLLRSSCQPGSPHFKPFLNRLFNMINWALTEFTVSASELQEQRGVRQLGELRNQTRRTAIMFDLSVTLLRILEFVVVQVPGAFLPSDQKVNLSRVMELLGFALSHFTVGPDARRLNELIQAAAGGGAAAAGSQARLQQNMLLEKVSKAAVLAPVVGILLGLAPRQQAQHGQQAGQAAQQGGGKAEGLLVAQLVASTDARMPEYLQFVKGLDWCAAFPAVPLSGHLRLLEQLLADYSTARAAAAESAQHTAALEAEVPEEFLDPITMTLMQDPVVLPDSQVTVDRSTIERHLLSGSTDPFSRAELSLDMVEPDTELAGKLAAWLEARQQKAGGGAQGDPMQVD